MFTDIGTTVCSIFFKYVKPNEYDTKNEFLE